MPPGWRLDKTWGSPEHGWEPIHNGKSLLNGGKKGLLKRQIKKETLKDIKSPQVSAPIAVKVEPKQNNKKAAKPMNHLAREKFKEKLLQEIVFDLMVCKIEGWDHKQYTKELKQVIDTAHLSVNGA